MTTLWIVIIIYSCNDIFIHEKQLYFWHRLVNKVIPCFVGNILKSRRISILHVNDYLLHYWLLLISYYSIVIPMYFNLLMMNHANNNSYILFFFRTLIIIVTNYFFTYTFFTLRKQIYDKQAIPLCCIFVICFRSILITYSVFIFKTLTQFKLLILLSNKKFCTLAALHKPKNSLR